MDNKFSFQRGWSQVRRCDQQAVKSELLTAMNINNRVSFYERLNGMIEPRITEYEAIVQIFAKYGITDVWGEAINTGVEENEILNEIFETA